MPDYTRLLFLQCLDEWKTYPDKVRALPPREQADFLQHQGVSSLPDLLAHVAAWWEEADGIIRDRVAGKEQPHRKYDLDEFNAEALVRLSGKPEDELVQWYETQRAQIAMTVTGLGDEWLEVRTVSGWLDGVLLEHLKEHALDAPRFLLIDMLQREWDGYPGRFEALKPDEQRAVLATQGYPRFADVLAHIIAGWEAGIRVIGSGRDENPFEGQDGDAFNAAAVARFATTDETEVYALYERTRLVLLNLVGSAPDEIMSMPHVQKWLRADILEHYYEHRL